MEKVVRVIDSIMGSGKTTWAINMMNAVDSAKRFIFVTPFLGEVERIISSVTNRNFKQPTHNADGTKLTSLKRLIEQGADIATTHSLFELFDDETIRLIEMNGYTLILDEVVSPIELNTISPSDIRTMLAMEYIEIVDNRIIWTDKLMNYEYGYYDTVKKLAQAGTLFFHRDHYLINTMSPKLFELFDTCYVMTYFFEASLMCYYFDLHSIGYELLAIENGELVPRDVAKEDRVKYKALINIYEGDYNKIGADVNAFSRGWLGRQTDKELKTIKDRMYSYVKHITHAKSDEVIWTSLQDFQSKFKGLGYTKGFLPCNARATNEYSDRSTLMYSYNRYMNPIERSFFQDNGVTVDEDKLALSDLLQWIWRSRIRRGEPINLFLPSSRMRKLLNAWLDGEI